MSVASWTLEQVHDPEAFMVLGNWLVQLDPVKMVGMPLVAVL
jgi:hypothetical protein